MIVGSEVEWPPERGGGKGGNVTRGAVSVGRRFMSSRRTITVGSIPSDTVGERLARLISTVGSVETASEPGAGPLNGLATDRTVSSRAINARAPACWRLWARASTAHRRATSYDFS